MQNIDSTETVEPGEQVLTAGIELAGGIRSPYPKGLLIGEITDVQHDPSSVVQTAYLQPTTNLDKVAYVLVDPRLRRRPAGRGGHADRLRQHRPGGRCRAASSPASSRPHRRQSSATPLLP